MRTKSAILILVCVLILSACGEMPKEPAEGFELSEYGEVFASENAVFCVENETVSLYALKGEMLCAEEFAAESLRHDTEGSFAVLYGENEFLISNGRTIKHNYINNIIMSTTINPNGYSAVCAEEAGYKGAVTVYDEKFTPVYRWYSASEYIIKAVLSEKNTLAVLTADENGSTARVFSLDSEELWYSVFIPEELAIDVCFMGDRLCLLSENAVYFTDGDKITESAEIDGRLGEYAMEDSFVLLECVKGDGTSVLLSYDAKGHKNGKAECETLRGLATDADNIAVLSGNDAVRFDESLDEICRADARGVRGIMLSGKNMLLLRDCEIAAYK